MAASPAAQVANEVRGFVPMDDPAPPRGSSRAGCAWLTRALGSGLLLCLLAISACEQPSPQQRIENAKTNLQRGDTQRAIAELKQVLQEQPDDAGVRLMLGQVYLASGNLPSAEKELGRARTLGLDSAELAAALGELWLKQGRREQLLRELRPQEDWPKDAQIAVHRLRARASLGMHDFAAARRAYGEMLQIGPDNVDARIGLVRVAMRAEGAGAGEIMLSDALRIAPDHPTLLGLRGDLAFQRGAYADAAADYRRQFETAPDNVAARLALAEALIAAGDRAQANALLDAFLAERPGNGPANYLRAAAAFQEGDAETVQEHSERAVHAMPTHVPSMFLLGAGSYALGRLEYARANFEKVLARQPDHAAAQRLLAATDQQLTLAKRNKADPARAGERLFRVDLAAVQGVAPEQNRVGSTEAAEAGRLARAGDHDAAAEILAELAERRTGQPRAPRAARRARPARRPTIGGGACVRGSSARAAGGRAGAQARVRAVAGRSARHQPGDARSLAGPRARRPRDPADAG